MRMTSNNKPCSCCCRGPQHANTFLNLPAIVFAMARRMPAGSLGLACAYSSKRHDLVRSTYVDGDVSRIYSALDFAHPGVLPTAPEQARGLHSEVTHLRHKQDDGCSTGTWLEVLCSASLTAELLPTSSDSRCL